MQETSWNKAKVFYLLSACVAALSFITSLLKLPTTTNLLSSTAALIAIPGVIISFLPAIKLTWENPLVKAGLALIGYILLLLAKAYTGHILYALTRINPPQLSLSYALLSIVIAAALWLIFVGGLIFIYGLLLLLSKIVPDLLLILLDQLFFIPSTYLKSIRHSLKRKGFKFIDIGPFLGTIALSILLAYAAQYIFALDEQTLAKLILKLDYQTNLHCGNLPVGIKFAYLSGDEVSIARLGNDNRYYFTQARCLTS